MRCGCILDPRHPFSENFSSSTGYHHHHVVPLGWISPTLSRHFSLSFIASGSSSGLQPVSSHSCYMYVLAGRPAFALPYVGVHRSTSLMNSSLLLLQCPACLIFVVGGRWPYSWCLVGCFCREGIHSIYSKACEEGYLYFLTDLVYLFSKFENFKTFKISCTSCSADSLKSLCQTFITTFSPVICFVLLEGWTCL